MLNHFIRGLLEDMDKSHIVTFCDALKEKYCDLEYDSGLVRFIWPKNEEIVMDQQNHRQRINLSLDGCQINNAGDDEEILETCPLVKDLDLSHNFLHDWVQVFSIANQLKYLYSINLSHNPLQDVTFPVDSLTGKTYPCLEELILNKTNTQFATLLQLLTLFPRVHELHISLNGYGTVPETSNQYTALTFLFFADNEIQCWGDIERLGLMFPSLQALIVSENPLECIPVDSNPEKIFPFLQKLSIAKTRISDWSSLEQLRRFPCLSDIRFSQIPLLNEYENEKTRRQLLISRLPNMKVMNGGAIEDIECEDADRAFIRYYKKMTDKPTRYFELLKVYGELDDLADVCLDKSSHVSVTLEGDIGKSVMVQVDIRQKTSDFRKYIADAYNLKCSKFRMFYHSCTLVRCGGDLMKYNEKVLGSYNMEDGDKIEIQRLDVGNT